MSNQPPKDAQIGVFLLLVLYPKPQTEAFDSLVMTYGEELMVDAKGGADGEAI
jgi:hypothetical protein